MNRKKFIQGLGLVTTTLAVSPNTLLGQDRPDALDKEVVRKFVGAGHSKLDVVKEMVAEHPNLVYSSWDWGGGDFETAIGAAGHVGYKEIVEFLIENGARPTLFVLTMLGKTELVKPTMETYPHLITSLGPHGYTFLHHAKQGGTAAEELYEYFLSKGLKETRVKLT